MKTALLIVLFPLAVFAGFTSGPTVGYLTNGTVVRPQVTGLTMWIDPAAIAATNGQPINLVPDVSGNGQHLYNAPTSAGTNCPVLYSTGGINGAPALDMRANWNRVNGNPPSLAYCLTNGAWNPGMTNNCTLTIVFQDMLEKGGGLDTLPLLNGGNTPTVLQFGTNNFQFGLRVHSVWTCGEMNFNGLYWPSTPSLASTETLMSSQNGYLPNVVTITMTNGTGDCWLNGLKYLYNYTYASASYLPAGTNLVIGNFFYGGTQHEGLGSFCGYVGDIILSTNAESPNEIASLHRYLMQKYGMTTSRTVAFDGDSITTGIYGLSHSNFISLAKAAMPDTRFISEAVPGATSGNIIGRQTNWLSFTPANTVEVCMIGVNDINNGTNFATLSSNVVNAANYARSLGKKFLICTLPSFNGEIGHTVIRTNYNVWITNNPQYFDGIIRYDLDPEMGTNASYSNVPNTNLWNGDGVHLTGDAYRRLTQRWLMPALQSVFASQNFTSGVVINGTNWFYKIFNNVLVLTNSP